MQRLAKHASRWALLALFGCISVFGPGWHYFVGHQFHQAPCHHETSDDHDHGCTAAREHHAPPEGSPAAVAVHQHDCPLCQFFAQAQWTVELAEAEFELAAVGSASFVERNWWIERMGSYRSRAPPCSSPIC